MGKEIQTLIFDSEQFTRQEALQWAKEHRFKYYTSRVEKDGIHIRQFDPERIKKTYGQFSLTEGIEGLYVEV